MARCCIAFLLFLLDPLAAWAQAPCPARLFVSGFNSGVHVYDACTGQYLRNLDTAGRLAGAMAVRLGPDGLLYAVAETGGAIHKYRNDDLAYVGQYVAVPGIGATGLAFDAAGIAYVAGYNSDDVKRFDRSGAALGPAFPARAAGLNGPDSGMTFGRDGHLYVPGYDSNSVVAWNPATGEARTALAARSAGLLRTRGLLPSADGRFMFVTGEGSNQLLRWDLQSGAAQELARITFPTGIDYAPDGKLLVGSGDAVVRVDPASGEVLGTLVAANAGGLTGQVFLSVLALPQAAPLDASQVGSQYWVVGDARFDGRLLRMPTVFSATGTAFGPNLRRAELTVRRWGSVEIELVSCTEARFRWDSTGAHAAGFGGGSYDLVRYFDNEATARCRAQGGVDHADKSWVNGQWWGGEARSGEGLFLDRNADGTTFFAWFTHRPAPGASVDAAQVGTQYWVVGDAVFAGRVLELPTVFSATGTQFGPGLRRADLAIKRWGAVRFELVSCTEARFSWDAAAPGSAGFGSGSYTVHRYFENEDTQRCRERGVDHADKSWVSGQWWGGEARSGEGLFLDRRADGTTFFAWFTHRPR